MYNVIERDYTLTKKGIWLFLWLLIFEGALRKWILPGLASPLLLVREPVSIFLMIMGLKYGMLKENGYFLVYIITTLISCVATMLFGHQNLFVMIYGARIYLLDFPVIFIIRQVFSFEDVIKVGRYILAISIGMTALMAMQYFSPQTAFVNLGVGGEGSAGFSASGAGADVFRPSGTFSFTSGLGIFFALANAFIFYFWLNPKYVRKPLLIAATITMLIDIPLSLSRTVLFETVLCGAFASLTVIRKPKVIFSIVTAFVVFLILIPLLSKFQFFQVTLLNFTNRLTTANTTEGGVKGVLLDRVLGGLLSALKSDNSATFWGSGIGIGTNAGAKILTGSRAFLVAEGEWGRVVGEMGLLMGLAIITVRVILGIKILLYAFHRNKTGNTLPWMLASAALPQLIMGHWAQPTALGFAVLLTGLCLASFKQPVTHTAASSVGVTRHAVQTQEVLS